MRLIKCYIYRIYSYDSIPVVLPEINNILHTDYYNTILCNIIYTLYTAHDSPAGRGTRLPPLTLGGPVTSARVWWNRFTLMGSDVFSGVRMCVLLTRSSGYARRFKIIKRSNSTVGNRLLLASLLFEGVEEGWLVAPVFVVAAVELLGVADGLSLLGKVLLLRALLLLEVMALVLVVIFLNGAISCTEARRSALVKRSLSLFSSGVGDGDVLVVVVLVVVVKNCCCCCFSLASTTVAVAVGETIGRTAEVVVAVAVAAAEVVVAVAVGETIGRNNLFNTE